MSVKKKVTPSIKTFIEKGADVKASKNKGFRNILVRIPTDILYELDAFLLLNKPWVSRTQWIVEALHEKLKSDADIRGV